jgi:hypothetical protein
VGVDETLRTRRKAFEEEFFQREQERLRQALREKENRAQIKEELRSVTGIDDSHILEKLAELGVHVDTLAAVALVPLVEVAWADGKLQEREREALLAAARELGIDPRHPSYELFSSWLTHRPETRMLDAWTAYVQGLAGQLDPAERATMRDKLLGRARAVAEAAGGFLGLGKKISPEEETALGMLENAFDGS